MKNTIEKNPTLEIVIEYNPYTLQVAGTNGMEFLDKIEELGLSIKILAQDEEKSQKEIKEEILKIKYPNTTNLYLKKSHQNS